MLPQRLRLSKDRIAVVFSEGKRYASSPFLLYMLPTTTSSKFAIIVHKRVAKHAMERVRIKRLVRSFLGNFNLSSPIEGIVVVTQIPNLTQSTINPQLQRLFQRAGLLS